MNKNKILSLFIAGVLIAGISSNAVMAADNNWNESNYSEVSDSVNKIKIYKDAIIIYTNLSYRDIYLYDDNGNEIIKSKTDNKGNAILNISGYNDYMYKDHYLKINGLKIFLDNNICDIKNEYYYKSNADDEYDPTDTDENDSRVFPKYDLSNSYNEINGELKDYSNRIIKLYIDDKYTASAKINKNNKFNIKLNEPVRNKHMIKFYVKNNMPKTSEIEPWDIAVSEFSVMGKYKPDTEIKAYYGKKELGRAHTSESGDFEIKTIYRLPRNASVKFYDVNSTSLSINEKGYIKGFYDGTFRPDNNITRAEAAVMISRLMMGKDDFNTNSTKFSDSNNKWYSGAVNYISEKGIIKGYKNGTFKPDAYITRAEFVKMISNYLNESPDQTSGFRDISNHWAKDDINILTERAYINGYPDGYFRPDNRITRAEAVKILNKTFNINGSGDENIDFKDVNKNSWYYYEIIKALNN